MAGRDTNSRTGAVSNDRQRTNVHRRASLVPSIENDKTKVGPCKPISSEFEGGFTRFNPTAANSPHHGSSYIEKWLQEPYATATSKAAPGFEGLERPLGRDSPRPSTEIGSEAALVKSACAPSYDDNDGEYGLSAWQRTPATQYLGEPSSPVPSNSQASPPHAQNDNNPFVGRWAGVRSPSPGSERICMPRMVENTSAGPKLDGPAISPRAGGQPDPDDNADLHGQGSDDGHDESKDGGRDSPGELGICARPSLMSIDID